MIKYGNLQMFLHRNFQPLYKHPALPKVIIFSSHLECRRKGFPITSIPRQQKCVPDEHNATKYKIRYSL